MDDEVEMNFGRHKEEEKKFSTHEGVLMDVRDSCFSVFWFAEKGEIPPFGYPHLSFFVVALADLAFAFCCFDQFFFCLDNA